MQADDQAALALLWQAFGDIVRARRTQLGLTVEQLAARSAVEQWGIEEIERGARGDPPKRDPNHDALAGLTHGLQWTVDELLFAYRSRLSATENQ